MNRKPKRYYNEDDCKCCLYCCIPVIALSFTFENLFKCICCCPCYVNLYYEQMKNERINRQINPAPEVIPVAIAIPIDEKILDRYSGKIWGGKIWGH